jgi:hypothetical protein
LLNFKQSVKKEPIAKIATTSVVIQKFLFFICHSGLDPESSVYRLDSRLRGNDSLKISVKKC